MSDVIAQTDEHGNESKDVSHLKIIQLHETLRMKRTIAQLPTLKIP